MPANLIQVNRAPVLTLWAAVVAERLSYDRETALTLGKTLAGLNAQSKGRRLGIFHAAEDSAGHTQEGPTAGAGGVAAPSVVEFMGREIAAVRTPDGFRATVKGQATDPASVERYLAGKFGEALPAVRDAMERLARSTPPHDLASQAYALYEDFRPAIPAGAGGWGAKGNLDLDRIRALAHGPAR
jgi:hypothetical protein